MKKLYFFALLAVLAVLLISCSSGKKTAAKKPAPGITKTNAAAPPAPSGPSTLVPYLTPAEEVKKFDIRDDYKLELVLSDPIIREPVAVAFDGDGRMYVAEMRTYMQDIDGRNQMAPKSRVSLHWSSKHDGVYDKHTVFADNLVLPRMILPLDKGVLINETDTDDIYLYEDTKGDGVADKKILWHKGGSRGGNLEHQASGMVWSLDNWIYMGVNAYRLRIKGDNVIKEDITANGGQWGITQDDYGKTWVVNAGYEVGPTQYFEPIIYGWFHWAGEVPSPQFAEVWPLVNLADYQGGPSRIRPSDQTLNHFTATCGPDIFRGDRLPPDLRGDLLFCEPVGRLVRRAKIVDHEGFTELTNAYPKSEFIRSTDPNFRPVNLATAPDGTLYVVDMYRGIIQESGWVNQGSYLRGVVEKYQLDRNFGRGRIWRLTHKSYKPGPQPHMLEETPAQLVKHIEHPNGWWRDTAQKLLVLRGDKSVVPALVKMVRSNTNHLVRIQALWTLEGLDALEPSLIREKLKDENPKVRIAAIRASETLYKAGDHSLVADIVPLAKDPDPDVVLQVLLSAHLYKWPGWDELIRTTVAASKAYGVKKIMGLAMPGAAAPAASPNKPPEHPAPPAVILTAGEKKLLSHGEEIYKELCFACHGLDGKGTPLAGAKPGTTMAPPLSGSKTATGFPDQVVSVVLKGLSGPVNGVTYDAQMVPMQNGDDDWIASVTSYIRNSYGNHAGFITTNDVARIRAALKAHPNPWTLRELAATLPVPMQNRMKWKLTASNNAGALPKAVDGAIETRYDTGTHQSPGMWVQIELPEATEVSGVILDAGAADNDFPQGYKVELSLDGRDWGRPVATGNGTCAYTQIVFPTARAKFIKITQTGSHPTYFWSIYELQVLQPAGARKIEMAMAEPPKADTLPADPFDIDPLALPPVRNENPDPAPAVKPPPPAPKAVPVPTVVPAPPPKAPVAPLSTHPSASAAPAPTSDQPSPTPPPFPMPPGFATARPAAPAVPASGPAAAPPLPPPPPKP